MGNKKILPSREIQLMRARSGVLHSEFYPSLTEPVRFLQIWIVPDERNLPPASPKTPMSTPRNTALPTDAAYGCKSRKAVLW